VHSASEATRAHGTLSGAALRNASPEVQRQQVARQFEAILVRQMLGKTMTSMLGSEEAGASASVFGDLLTDTFAQQLTQGQGLGMSRLIEKQLAPRTAHAALHPISNSAKLP
jgi:Rod binding domain-containing protein